MLNWSAICPALIQAFTAAASDQPESPAPPWTAEWADRARTLMHPDVGLALTLRVTSCVTINEDEDRIDADGVETQCGLRRFVVNVRAESTEDEDAASALQAVERVRTRIRRRKIADALLAVDVALIEVGSTQNVSATFDGRVWSIASLDVTFCAAINDTDPVPTGVIARVVLTTAITDSPTQLDHVEIP